MQLEYFTIKGAIQVIETYNYLVGEEFYFDDSEMKQKLVEIKKQELSEKGYIIIFQSEQLNFLPIYKFMPRNGIEYNFYDFDIKKIDI